MICLIVAMAENRTIGANGKIPWRIPGELAYFKRVTMGHPIVMGRKTYESIGKPLPGRPNYIVTRNPHYVAEGCHVVHEILPILELASRKTCLSSVGRRCTSCSSHTQTRCTRR